MRSIALKVCGRGAADRATERRIDRLVYELYGLSEDEVRIVEEASGVKP
jgi:hypothetical protein